jgi:hypothetical protein
MPRLHTRPSCAPLAWLRVCIVALVAAVHTGCGGVRDAASPATTAAREESIDELVRFGNEVYAMPEAQLLELYKTFQRTPSDGSASGATRRAFVAHALSVYGQQTDLATHLDAIRNTPRARTSATDFAALVAQMIAADSITRRYQACQAQTHDLKLKLDGATKRCNALQHQLDGLINLESEMNRRSGDALGPPR